MSTTQPIKDMSQIQLMKDYYTNQKPNPRNYALFCLGINSALRISDLLQLRWENVYNFEKQCYRKHLSITEQKTKKQTQIAVNDSIKDALERYRISLPTLEPGAYIFPGGRDRSKSLSRVQAYRIIKNAAEVLHFEEGFSCHSLRKTFGYHAWKQGAHPAILTEIYNHSSYQITRRYLGIDQDDKDDLFLSVHL